MFMKKCLGIDLHTLCPHIIQVLFKPEPLTRGTPKRIGEKQKYFHASAKIKIEKYP
jgi:hypothetical protein